MKRFLKTIAAFSAIVMVLVLFPAAPLPTAEAATITLYPANYTYVKPAPYWTCDPCDEFGTGQQVKILWRDYNFFYIEYTKNGVLRRGFAAMSHFNSADYAGYSWASYDYFIPAYNATTMTINIYEGPSNTYRKMGTLAPDAGEPMRANTLTLLKSGGEYCFVQWITNPNSTEQPIFHRGWVWFGYISAFPHYPTADIDANNYVLIKNVGTGTYLQLNGSADTDSGYDLSLVPLSDAKAQHWHVPRNETAYNSSLSDYSYRLIGIVGDMAWEVNGKIPVLDAKLVVNAQSPMEENKAQDFYFCSTGDSYGSYQILTRCSGGYLALQANSAGTAVYQERKSSSDYQKWVIEPFDAYVKINYLNVPKVNNISQLKYYIVKTGNTAISNADITSSIITTAVSYWNAKKEQTGVQLVPTNILSEAHFTIASSDNIGNAHGRTDSLYNQSDPNNPFFTQVEVKLSQTYLQNEEESYKTFVVCHELGHALGLTHTDVCHNDNNSYPYYLYYSVMNDGNYYFEVSNPENRANTPTNYDYRTLQCKWKGAKNV